MRKTLGIIGGGQLGRMITQAAHDLKLKVIVLDPTPQSPAGIIADKQIIGDFKDPKQIEKLGKIVDYLTFEIESANTQILKKLAKSGVSINPPGETLEIIQDKFLQKQFLQKLNIPIADFAVVNSQIDLEQFIQKYKYPVILKARVHGYDGRGNALIRKKAEIKEAFKKVGRQAYVEKVIPLKRELAIQVARNIKGQIKSYPLVETIQKNNICHYVLAPAKGTKKIELQAAKIAKKVITNFAGAGVFGIEMFETPNGQVLLNEIAPRVHNSGHYTIEACKTSQFEQHVRAVSNLPLGATTMKAKAAVMVNI
ncbi:5-(carboxyamino)imidazole ribonucleotide synthase [Candidatus Curtissbacteria bacterium]|nr:5-(carboxyamino)imidazole ribonucleotide synthase [Candidatus Curtissbacteria bacterium]